MNLNFKILGEENKGNGNSPVVILHGLFGMLDNWQTFGKKLAKDGYMVYLIDQRDHGKSPKTESFNYTLLAHDINDFLDQQAINTATIIGHSMGGKAAMMFANLFPHRLHKLIVVDIAPKQYYGGHEIIMQALAGLDLKNTASRKDFYAVLNDKFNDEGLVHFLMKNITRDKKGGFALKMNLSLLSKSYSQIMEGINFTYPLDVSTLFVKGGESNYISENDWDEISDNFLNAELKTIEGAGHWVHAQKPNELFEVISSFIKEN